MKAVVIKQFGKPDVLTLEEVDRPPCGAGEVLVRVRATAINRADVLQRRGLYPAPPDAPQNIPGLEFSGEIEQVGASISQWQQGDRVFGLAAGGTYAEYLVVHPRTLARIPENISFVEAAAIPEAFITAYDAVVSQGGLCAGEKLLITAVGSGVGTAAVQIARAIGAVPYGTARSQAKIDAAMKLGLEDGVVESAGQYAQAVLATTGGAGPDVILELVGGNYIIEDIVCAAVKGRIILVGLTGGSKVEADLAMILRKRLMIKGTTLRARPLEEKIAAGQLLARNLAPLIAEGKLKPIIDKELPLSEAAAAHEFMEANKNFGKVVLVL